MNVADLTGLCFLDTNVLVYTFDATAPDKCEKARGWVCSALQTGRGIISTQVVQEFLHVATRKFASPLTAGEAVDYLNTILAPLCQHHPSLAGYETALRIREKTGLSWYDALIVTAALETGCRWLISEDLGHGQSIRTVTIINPFK
jgi:predicted nucleic acid-binding protein